MKRVVKKTAKKIKKAVKELYEVEIAKVNTLIRPVGYKKAYVKLTLEAKSIQHNPNNWQKKFNRILIYLT